MNGYPISRSISPETTPSCSCSTFKGAYTVTVTIPWLDPAQLRGCLNPARFNRVSVGKGDVTMLLDALMIVVLHHYLAAYFILMSLS